MESWIIWLITAGIVLIIELLTQTMWALCLSVGILVAAIVSYFGAGLEIQLAALIVGSLAAYLSLGPIFRKYKNRGQKDGRDARTGMEALLGRKAVVTHEIRPGELGRVRIDGDNWQVRAPGVSTTIERGSEVTVISYDSIILDVAPYTGMNH